MQDQFLREASVRAVISHCGFYVPVITFTSSDGLSSTFNTFRRGGGWYNRLVVGDKVDLRDTRQELMKGKGKIVEKFTGALGPLLDDHAAMNHMLRDTPELNAPAKLRSILETMYGKNYTRPDEVFSVIYVEVLNDDSS